MHLIELDLKWAGETIENGIPTLLPKACEALFSLRERTCPGAEVTGWFDDPKIRGFQTERDISNFVEGYEYAYDTVVVIGIGGSYLGTKAVVDALGKSFRAPGDKKIVYCGCDLSEGALIELVDHLDECLPIVNVISKSGTTTEPAIAFRIIRKYMEKRFGKEEASGRITAITDAENGALRKLANEQGYSSFVIPDDVGGRFSVLTSVALVPLKFAGFDTRSLLEGADQVFSEFFSDEKGPNNHPALQYAACRHVAYDAGYKLEILSNWDPKLKTVAEWWKQLYGESEGKDGKGLFPVSTLSTTDLHSLGQYVQQGERHLFETILTVEEPVGLAGRGGVERRLKVPELSDNLDGLGYLENRHIFEINEAAKRATQVAHFDGGVPVLELTMKRLDEKHLGGLFAFFETSCAVSALLLGVNPFNQPGVEDYKKNLFGLLGKPGFEEIGRHLRTRL